MREGRVSGVTTNALASKVDLDRARRAEHVTYCHCHNDTSQASLRVGKLYSALCLPWHSAMFFTHAVAYELGVCADLQFV